MAEGHALRSLGLLSGTGKTFSTGGAYNILGRAFLRRRQPDPERAVDAVTTALDDGIAGMRSRIVVENAGELWREMAARWGSLPAVRDLGELVVSARKALPVAGGT